MGDDNNVEKIRIEIDDSDALRSEQKVNAGMEGIEKQAGKTQRAIQQSITTLTNGLEGEQKKILTISQTSEQSMRRIVQSAQRRAAFASANSPSERAAIERDLGASRLSGDQKKLQDFLAATGREISAYKKQEYDTALNKAAAASEKAASNTIVFDRALQKITKSTKQAVDEYQRLTNVVGKSGIDKIDADRSARLASARTDQERRAAQRYFAKLEAQAAVKEASTAAETTAGSRGQVQRVLIGTAIGASAEQQVLARRAASIEAETASKAALESSKAAETELGKVQQYFLGLGLAQRQQKIDQLRREKTAVTEIAQLEDKAATASLSGIGKQIFAAEKLLVKYADQPKRIEAIKASIDRLRQTEKLEQEQSAASGHGGIFSRSTAGGRFFLGAKDFFEGRTTYGQVEVATGLSKLGGAALLVGGITTALVAAGAASIAAAKSLANYGTEVRDVELRTGLSAKEVQQFAFAAKASNQDVSIFERTMRGLSQAIEGDDASATKARGILRGFGVDVQAVKDGTAGTADTLLKISAGLNGIANPFERDKTALDLLKRAGIEAIPTLVQLQQRIALANKEGLGGVSEGEIKRFEQIQEHFALISAKLEEIKIKYFKEPLVNTMEFVIKVGSKTFDFINGINEITGALLRIASGAKPAGAQKNPYDLGSVGDDPLLKLLNQGGDARNKQRVNSLEGVIGSGLSGAEDKLTKLRKNYEDIRKEADDLVKSQKVMPDQLDQIVSRLSKARGLYESQDKLVKDLRGQPEHEKAAHDYLLKSLNAETEARTKQSVSATFGLTDATVNLWEARVKAVDEYTKRVKELREEGSATPVALRDIGSALIANIYTAQANSVTAREKEFKDQLRNEQQLYGERLKFDLEFNNESLKLATAAIDDRFSFEERALEISKDRQIRSIENTDAKTLQAKVTYELRKGEIEATFSARREQLQLDAIGRELNSELTLLKGTLDAKLISEAQYRDRVDALNAGADEKRRQAIINAEADIAKAREEAQLKSIETIRNANTRVFDSFKRESEGVFDAMTRNGQNAAQAIGNVLKNVFLTTLKDIVSTQSARFLTQIFTGQKVGLTPENPAPGILGRIGATFGIGSRPTFNSKEALTKLDLPGHLGDVSAVSSSYGAAVPVVIANIDALQQQGSQQTTVQNAFSIFSGGAKRGLSIAGGVLAAGLPLAAAGLGSLGGGGGAGAGAGIAQSTISFPGAGGIQQTFPGQVFGGGGAFGGGSIATPPFFPTDQGLGGVGSGIPGLGGGSGASGGSAGGSGGPLSGISKYFNSNSLKNFFLNQNGIAIKPGLSTTGAGSIGGFGLQALSSPFAGVLGAGLLLSGISNPRGKAGAIQSTVGGGLLGTSIGAQIPALGLVNGGILGAGAGLAINGLQRGGKLGILETTAGGAAIGFALGGPIGAAIGAGVGFVAGLVRSFFKTATEKAREKIKTRYGVDIKDNKILQQIVQIGKDQFGGNLDAAILSMPVRNLIELYGQATGQNVKGVVAHAQASIFANQNGQLSQQATYFNGSPVFPGQTQSSVGLPQLMANGLYTTTPVQSGANVFHGTIQLDAAATSAVLQGQAADYVSNNGRAVASSAQDGTQQAGTLRSTAANLLQPGLGRN
jgi:hypothetical protein